MVLMLGLKVGFEKGVVEEPYASGMLKEVVVERLTVPRGVDSLGRIMVESAPSGGSHFTGVRCCYSGIHHGQICVVRSRTWVCCQNQ